MRVAVRNWGVLALLAVLPACGDSSEATMDLGGDDLGPDRHAIVGRDGDVKMGLTDEYVYFGLSDATLEKARAEMRSEAEGDGAGGFVGGLLENTVGKALGFRARLAVSDIEDIRWENGRMRIVFADPDRSFGDNFSIEDRPVTESFAEEDVREFAEAFHQVKEEGGSRRPADAAAADDDRGADTTGSW